MEGSKCTIKWQSKKIPSSYSIIDVLRIAFHSITSSNSASEAPLYLEFHYETTNPKTPLPSASKQNTHTQSDSSRLFVYTSSRVPGASHVALPQCLIAIIINPLQPCIQTQQFVLLLRLSQSAG